MEKYNFSLWFRLTISAVIGALFYHLSRYNRRDKSNEKASFSIKKTRDKIKRLFSPAKAVEDSNKSVIYTLSRSAKR